MAFRHFYINSTNNIDETDKMNKFIGVNKTCRVERFFDSHTGNFCYVVEYDALSNTNDKKEITLETKYNKSVNEQFKKEQIEEDLKKLNNEQYKLFQSFKAARYVSSKINNFPAYHVISDANLIKKIKNNENLIDYIKTKTNFSKERIELITNLFEKYKTIDLSDDDNYKDFINQEIVNLTQNKNPFPQFENK